MAIGSVWANYDTILECADLSALCFGATCSAGEGGVALRFPPQSKVAMAEVSLDCGGNRRATPLWKTS